MLSLFQTPSKAQFVENNKVTSSSGTKVDSSVALDAVTAWIKNSTGIPQHDHAMLCTRCVKVRKL